MSALLVFNSSCSSKVIAGKGEKSQEILCLCRPHRRRIPHIRWHGSKQLEGRLQVLSYLAHARHVGAPITVVWRRPDRHHVSVVKVVLVPFVDKLMCPRE
jgi:hypothetical protein